MEEEERSKFENMGDPQLRKYAAYVETVLKGQRVWADINDFFEFITWERNPTIVKKITSPVGGLSRMDIEYLFYIIINNDLDEEDSLSRPRLDDTSVDYVYDEKVYRRVRRSGKVSSYLGSDLTNTYLGTLKSEDYIDTWTWRVTDEQEDDWDIMSDWFDV